MTQYVVAALALLLVFSPNAVAAPPETAPAAFQSCGSPDAPAPGTVTNGSVTSGGIKRDYRLSVPASYTPGQRSPLLVALHGRGSNAEYMERNSGLSGLDAIVVYPQALVAPDGQTAWAGAPYSPDVDDVAFINDLIDRLSARLCVQENQVFAVGHSNGGGLSAMLGCRLADRLAGYATVSGAFYPEAGPCEPSRPIRLLNFHGAQDDIVFYDGNPRKGQPPIPRWMDDRAGLNRCTGRGPVRTPYPNVELDTWEGCAADVAHYRILDGGHEWPTRIDTPNIIWSFFRGS